MGCNDDQLLLLLLFQLPDNGLDIKLMETLNITSYMISYL